MSTALAAPSTLLVPDGRAVRPPVLAYRRLAALLLVTLMASLDTSIATAGLPAIAAAFDASFHAVQWVVLAHLLAVTTALVAVGRIGDALGRRRLLLAGIGLFTFASLLCGVAPSLALLIAGRAAQGLGAAILVALGVALVGEAVPGTHTGRAMGWLGSMSAAGTTVGPSLGGLLIASVGWRAIFLVNLPLGLLAAAMAIRYLPADPPPSTSAAPAPDRRSAVLLAGSLAAYALALTLGRGHFGIVNVLLLATAAAGAVAFVKVEATAAAPLIGIAMLREPAVAAGLAASAVVATVIMTTLVVGPFYLARTLGLAPAAAGLALSLGPLVAAVTGVSAGGFIDRHGSHRMTVLGLAVMTVGAGALCLIPAVLGLAGYLLPVGVMTAGYAVFQAANNTRVMTAAGEERRGLIAGALSLSRNLGLITGAAAMGGLFGTVVATADIAAATPAAVSVGIRLTFGVATLLLIGALIAAIRVRAPA